MSKAIVAIGGGEIRRRGTAPIDREIIRLTNKKHPKLLFIPTASSDSGRYWKHVQEYFGGFLSYSFCAKMWSMEAAPGPAISSVNSAPK